METPASSKFEPVLALIEQGDYYEAETKLEELRKTIEEEIARREQELQGLYEEIEASEMIAKAIAEKEKEKEEESRIESSPKEEVKKRLSQMGITPTEEASALVNPTSKPAAILSKLIENRRKK